MNWIRLTNDSSCKFYADEFDKLLFIRNKKNDWKIILYLELIEIFDRNKYLKSQFFFIQKSHFLAQKAKRC